MEILLGLAFAILSGIIGWLLAEPYRIPSWFALSKNENLTGIWYCSWQSKIGEKSHWTTDKVSLKKILGKLEIKVVESAEDFNWIITGSLRHPYLLGLWESQKPNAIACGTTSLKLTPQGDSMVGYWIGPANDPRMMTGKVVLSHSIDMLDELKNNFTKLV